MNSFEKSKNNLIAEETRDKSKIPTKFNEGLALHKCGELAQAKKIYEEILREQPGYFDAIHMLGVIALQTKELELAAILIDQAIEINSSNEAAFNHKGVILNKQNRPIDAVKYYSKAIDINPEFSDAYSNRGNAFNELKQHQKAVEDYDEAIKRKPEFAEAYNNRGVALNNLKQHQAAIESYNKAIALNPDSAETYSNRGVAQHCLHQNQLAIDSFKKAIALNPKFAKVYSNMGNVLQDLKQHKDAIECYKTAIELAPNYAECYNNRGVALSALKQQQAAIEDYNKALELKPDYEYLQGTRIHARMHICDWHEHEIQTAELLAKLVENKKVVPSFPVLSLTDAISLQRRAAEIWVNNKYPAKPKFENFPKKRKKGKIRLGYFSADFKEHAVPLLTAELFETHDRKNFEIYAFSFSQEAKDEMRHRLEKSFDRFMDVKNCSNEDIVKLSREIGIDIAIDLGGLTNDSRPDIFAMRAAPIQVNYIGYPGTMGASYIDYIIADAQVVPEKTRQHYTEKVVYLPCFQVNDSQRRVSEKQYARQEFGLPENGFVFCCFSSNYKINPKLFDSWIKILKQVNDSVLFLYSDSQEVSINLQQQAKQRGLDPGRLVFGKRMPLAEHLARYRCADLFLDTHPFNGGATVSDALWAGLPVLTFTGEAFASRMASSLLKAIDLPELITSDQDHYESLAIEMATKPEKLQFIKEKLLRNRRTTPLFDTNFFTKHIEAAYVQMLQRYEAGLPPDHIDVSMQSQTSLETAPNNKTIMTKEHEPKNKVSLDNMKTLLHVGCGPKRKDQTTPGFNSPQWNELRLDIDSAVLPDVLGTMTDMSSVESGTVDAIFSSHNIEHLYPHDVPVALAEFMRVLKPTGFVVITCPDLQAVCALVAEDKLTDPAYTSPAGPITPLDILYGHRPPMARGNLYMAHRCGFTQKVLISTLQNAGFAKSASIKRAGPFFDLWIAASKNELEDAQMIALAGEHFPK